ncbi:MAG: DUF1295 domain-containing protein [Myxococcales bacterium]|nr:DUF1295 domain-containing protein [Myxococcales bacterium]USN50334.1 MAG: DUF1295 domain-containing protein [Myxococcales bacterium]
MNIFIIQLILLVFLSLTLWIISLKLKKVSIIDIFWPIFFIIANLAACIILHPPLGSALLVMIPVCVWGVRLCVHLAKRNIKNSEDIRYVNLKKKYGSLKESWALWIVFLPQAILASLINFPLTVALIHGQKLASKPIVIFGMSLFVIGFLFETIADLQLTNFLKKRSEKQQIMNKGLWAWSRHPNYFGECTLWWGFYFISVGISENIFTIFSPILITFLLLRVSGVTMLDSVLKKTKPRYTDYIKNTSAFFPWPPKR